MENYRPTLNQQYFNSCEDKGWSLLNSLNDKYNFFTSLDRAEHSSPWDSSGITRDGREVLIELKVRKAVVTPQHTFSGSNFQDDTIFIEQNKHSNLMMMHVVKGFTPLYINFLLDGNVLIYNLLRITHFKEFRGLKVQSKGYSQMETNAARLGLYLDDASVVSL